MTARQPFARLWFCIMRSRSVLRPFAAILGQAASDGLVMRGLHVPIGLLALLISAQPARAHLMQTGFGGFYDGLAHLFITPSDLLLVLGLACLAGQNGPAVARTLCAVLPVAWLMGGWIGQGLNEPALGSLLTTVGFVAVGVLVALEVPMAAGPLASLAAGCGLLFGVVNGATMAPGSGLSLDLLGTVSGVACVSVLVGGQAIQCRGRASWMRMALRVLGSWIAAAGLLGLGLVLKDML